MRRSGTYTNPTSIALTKRLKDNRKASTYGTADNDVRWKYRFEEGDYRNGENSLYL